MSLPLLFSTSCILGLPLMQAGARHYPWLPGKLADNEFSSENKADVFQFCVWTKRRKHFICRERQLCWGTSLTQFSGFTSFGGSTLYQESLGSILPLCPSVGQALLWGAFHQFCLLQPLQIHKTAQTVPQKVAAPTLPRAWQGHQPLCGVPAPF